MPISKRIIILFFIIFIVLISIFIFENKTSFLRNNFNNFLYKKGIVKQIPTNKLEKDQGITQFSVDEKGYQYKGYLKKIATEKDELILTIGDEEKVMNYDLDTRFLCLPEFMPSTTGSQVKTADALIDTSQLVKPEVWFYRHTRDIDTNDLLVVHTQAKPGQEPDSAVIVLVISFTCN